MSVVAIAHVRREGWRQGWSDKKRRTRALCGFGRAVRRGSPFAHRAGSSETFFFSTQRSRQHAPAPRGDSGNRTAVDAERLRAAETGLGPFPWIVALGVKFHEVLFAARVEEISTGRRA